MERNEAMSIAVEREKEKRAVAQEEARLVFQEGAAALEHYRRSFEEGKEENQDPELNILKISLNELLGSLVGLQKKCTVLGPEGRWESENVKEEEVLALRSQVSFAIGPTPTSHHTIRAYP